MLYYHFKWIDLSTIFMHNIGCLDPEIRAGRNSLGQGQYVQAIKHLGDAHQRFPKDERVRIDLASAFRALASQQADTGDCDRAEKNLLKADALTQPNLSGVRTLYRCALSSKKDAAVRERIARRLVKLGDRRVSILRQIMLSLFEQGKEKEAVDFAPTLSQFGLQPQDIERVAQVLCRMKRYADCPPFLEKRCPTTDKTHLWLKAATAYSTQASTMRSVYLRLATEFPNNPVSLIRLAQFYKQTGKIDAAREALSRANQIRGIKPRRDRGLRPLLKSRR